MRLGKSPLCAALSTLSFCACDIHCEYSAQFTCGSITVKVVKRFDSFPFSCGAEALRPDLFAIVAGSDQDFCGMFNE